MGADCSLVLAAGKGTRMRSRLPKVLHPILGMPMLAYCLETAAAVSPRVVAVVGGDAGDVEKLAESMGARTVVQDQRLGTAHAVSTALPAIPPDVSTLLVLCGDTPLLRKETLLALGRAHRSRGAVMSILTTEMEDPTGYGRIIREAGRLLAIVEERDAGPQERAVREVNTGVYLFDMGFLREYLPRVGRENAQGEYYLTDLAGLGIEAGLPVEAFCLAHPQEALGINHRAALSRVEQVMLNSIRERWMMAGVTLENAPTIYIEPSVELERDVVIGPGAVLRGETRVGEGAVIGPCSVLESAEVEPGAVVPPHTHLCRKE